MYSHTVRVEGNRAKKEKYLKIISMDLEQLNLIINNYKRLVNEWKNKGSEAAFDYYTEELQYWQDRKDNF